MKLVYFTSKIFPATTADHYFVLEMSHAFTSILRKDFLLVVGDDRGTDLKDIPHTSFGLKLPRGKRFFIYYKSLVLIFLKRLYGKNTVFFSNDQSLLRLLFFWKKIFHFNYRVISDWHMLSGSENEPDVIKESDGLVTTTKHLKKLIEDKFQIDEKKILTAYGGVDLGVFFGKTEQPEELRKRLKLPVTDYLVGYAGYYKTMGMSKGLETMIDALSHIPDKTVKMAFIGGRPEEMDEYRLYAKQRALEKRTIFVERIPSEELALYEMVMDVLVIPYPDKPHYRDYGFPMKTYEYLAAKKPVIYSDLTIISEVLSDCARSFKPGNSKDLAEKIMEIKSDPTRAKKLVARGYAKVVDCTWKARAKKIITFAKGI